MSRRRLFASLVWIAASSASFSARADEAERRAAAQALFDEARRLMRDAAYESACSKFRASYEIDPGLGTLLHQADCYEKVGRLASAWATFELAIGIADQRGDVERGRVARVRAASLEARLPRIVIELEERPPGSEVRVDGRRLPDESIGASLPLDPGKHRIEVRAPRRRAVSRVVELQEGESALVVSVPPLEIVEPSERETPRISPPAAQAAKPATHATHPQVFIGASMAVVGLGGLAAGGVLGALAHSKNQASLDECRASDATLCSERGIALRGEARALAAWSTGTLIAGASLLGVGAVVYLSSGDGAERPEIALQVGPTSFAVARSF